MGGCGDPVTTTVTRHYFNSSITNQQCSGAAMTTSYLVVTAFLSGQKIAFEITYLVCPLLVEQFTKTWLVMQTECILLLFKGLACCAL